MDEFLERVAESIEGAEADSLEAGTDFKRLKNWDSLALLTLTDTIDMEYGVLLKKGEIDRCGTLGELYELVRTRMR